MTPRLLVTRAEPGASATAAALAARGAKPILCPLLTIVPLDASVPGPDRYCGIIFTSANGVRHFHGSAAWRDTPAFCVGTATREAALDAGYGAAISADGDATAVTTLATMWLAAHGGGALLHVRGMDAAGDIAGNLARSGFVVDTHICYQAAATQVLSAAAADALEQGGRGVDGVLFHSPRAASVGAQLLAAHAPKLAAAFISQAAADAGGKADWGGVGVAEIPTDAALIAIALAQMAARS